jgi:aminoglycoside/choline kinase family phosphotransferase
VRPIAGGAEDLSAEWLSAVLDTEIHAVSAKRIGTGQTSSAYRLSIDAPHLPATLVAKLAEGDEAARRRVATAHRCEVGFYTELADTLDVRTPACWYGAVSDDGAQFTLLLEDLAPRVPGRQVDGCSTEQANHAVRTLAELHACRWNDDSLYGMDCLAAITPERAQFLSEIASMATEQFISRFETRLNAVDISTLREVARVLRDWQLGRATPFSLVHGDYRLDNIMFPPTGDDVAIVDWQTITVALPARDLSYFIGTSLPTEQRRASEDLLVESYYEVLRSQGIEEYSLEQCFEDYRFGQLQGPLITVLGTMTSPGRSSEADDMFLSMAARSCAAIRDLGSLNLL